MKGTSERTVKPPLPKTSPPREREYEEIDFYRRNLAARPGMSSAPVLPRTGDGRHCDLCGCSEPIVRCDRCNNQLFCLSCDDMFHRHPKRMNHARKAIEIQPPPKIETNSNRPPLPPKSEHATPPLPPPRRKPRPPGFVTPMLPRKEMKQTAGDFSVTPMLARKEIAVLPKPVADIGKKTTISPLSPSTQRREGFSIKPPSTPSLMRKEFLDKVGSLGRKLMGSKTDLRSPSVTRKAEVPPPPPPKTSQSRFFAPKASPISILKKTPSSVTRTDSGVSLSSYQSDEARIRGQTQQIESQLEAVQQRMVERNGSQQSLMDFPEEDMRLTARQRSCSVAGLWAGTPGTAVPPSGRNFDSQPQFGSLRRGMNGSNSSLSGPAKASASNWDLPNQHGGFPPLQQAQSMAHVGCTTCAHGWNGGWDHHMHHHPMNFPSQYPWDMGMRRTPSTLSMPGRSAAEMMIPGAWHQPPPMMYPMHPGFMMPPVGQPVNPPSDQRPPSPATSHRSRNSHKSHRRPASSTKWRAHESSDSEVDDFKSRKSGRSSRHRRQSDLSDEIDEAAPRDWQSVERENLRREDSRRRQWEDSSRPKQNHRYEAARSEKLDSPVKKFESPARTTRSDKLEYPTTKFESRSSRTSRPDKFQSPARKFESPPRSGKHRSPENTESPCAWSCSHCTFLNDATDKICAICCKSRPEEKKRRFRKTDDREKSRSRASSLKGSKPPTPDSSDVSEDENDLPVVQSSLSFKLASQSTPVVTTSPAPPVHGPETSPEDEVRTSPQPDTRSPLDMLKSVPVIVEPKKTDRDPVQPTMSDISTPDKQDMHLPVSNSGKSTPDKRDTSFLRQYLEKSLFGGRPKGRTISESSCEEIKEIFKNMRSDEIQDFLAPVLPDEARDRSDYETVARSVQNLEIIKPVMDDDDATTSCADTLRDMQSALASEIVDDLSTFDSERRETKRFSRVLESPENGINFDDFPVLDYLPPMAVPIKRERPEFATQVPYSDPSWVDIPRIPVIDNLSVENELHRVHDELQVDFGLREFTVEGMDSVVQARDGQKLKSTVYTQLKDSVERSTESPDDVDDEYDPVNPIEEKTVDFSSTSVTKHLKAIDAAIAPENSPNSDTNISTPATNKDVAVEDTFAPAALRKPDYVTSDLTPADLVPHADTSNVCVPTLDSSAPERSSAPVSVPAEADTIPIPHLVASAQFGSPWVDTDVTSVANRIPQAHEVVKDSKTVKEGPAPLPEEVAAVPQPSVGTVAEGMYTCADIGMDVFVSSIAKTENFSTLRNETADQSVSAASSVEAGRSDDTLESQSPKNGVGPGSEIRLKPIMTNTQTGTDEVEAVAESKQNGVSSAVQTSGSAFFSSAAQVDDVGAKTGDYWEKEKAKMKLNIGSTKKVMMSTGTSPLPQSASTQTYEDVELPEVPPSPKPIRRTSREEDSRFDNYPSPQPRRLNRGISLDDNARHLSSFPDPLGYRSGYELKTRSLSRDGSPVGDRSPTSDIRYVQRAPSFDPWARGSASTWDLRSAGDQRDWRRSGQWEEPGYPWDYSSYGGSSRYKGSTGSLSSYGTSSSGLAPRDRRSGTESLFNSFEDVSTSVASSSAAGLQQRRPPDLTDILREAANEGFGPDDVRIALGQCGTHHPIDWLRNNWTTMIDKIVVKATKHGQKQARNTVGAISRQEAVAALRRQKGNMQMAIQSCIKQRQKKYVVLATKGNFSHEDIVTSLTAARGDVNEALAELQGGTPETDLGSQWSTTTADSTLKDEVKRVKRRSKNRDVRRQSSDRSSFASSTQEFSDTESLRPGTSMSTASSSLLSMSGTLVPDDTYAPDDDWDLDPTTAEFDMTSYTSRPSTAMSHTAQVKMRHSSGGLSPPSKGGPGKRGELSSASSLRPSADRREVYDLGGPVTSDHRKRPDKAPLLPSRKSSQGEITVTEGTYQNVPKGYKDNLKADQTIASTVQSSFSRAGQIETGPAIPDVDTLKASLLPSNLEPSAENGKFEQKVAGGSKLDQTFAVNKDDGNDIEARAARDLSEERGTYETPRNSFYDEQELEFIDDSDDDIILVRDYSPVDFTELQNKGFPSSSVNGVDNQGTVPLASEGIPSSSGMSKHLEVLLSRAGSLDVSANQRDADAREIPDGMVEDSVKPESSQQPIIGNEVETKKRENVEIEEGEKKGNTVDMVTQAKDQLLAINVEFLETSGVVGGRFGDDSIILPSLDGTPVPAPSPVLTDLGSFGEFDLSGQSSANVLRLEGSRSHASDRSGVDQVKRRSPGPRMAEKRKRNSTVALASSVADPESQKSPDSEAAIVFPPTESSDIPGSSKDPSKFQEIQGDPSENSIKFFDSPSSPAVDKGAQDTHAQKSVGRTSDTSSVVASVQEESLSPAQLAVRSSPASTDKEEGCRKFAIPVSPPEISNVVPSVALQGMPPEPILKNSLSPKEQTRKSRSPSVPRSTRLSPAPSPRLSKTPSKKDSLDVPDVRETSRSPVNDNTDNSAIEDLPDDSDSQALPALTEYKEAPVIEPPPIILPLEIPTVSMARVLKEMIDVETVREDAEPLQDTKDAHNMDKSNVTDVDEATGAGSERSIGQEPKMETQTRSDRLTSLNEENLVQQHVVDQVAPSGKIWGNQEVDAQDSGERRLPEELPYSANDDEEELESDVESEASADSQVDLKSVEYDDVHLVDPSDHLLEPVDLFDVGKDDQVEIFSISGDGGFKRLKTTAAKLLSARLSRIMTSEAAEQFRPSSASPLMEEGQPTIDAEQKFTEAEAEELLSSLVEEVGKGSSSAEVLNKLEAALKKSKEILQDAENSLKEGGSDLLSRPAEDVEPEPTTSKSNLRPLASEQIVGVATFEGRSDDGAELLNVMEPKEMSLDLPLNHSSDFSQGSSSSARQAHDVAFAIIDIPQEPDANGIKNKAVTRVSQAVEEVVQALEARTSSSPPKSPPLRKVERAKDSASLLWRLVEEGRVPSMEKAQLAAHLVDLRFEEEEAVEAALECGSIYSALSYLRQECELCATKYPAKQMVSMLNCVHRCCRSCAGAYFSTQIRDRPIFELVCPFCREPSFGDDMEEEANEYFMHLEIMLKGLLETPVFDLYERKLRDLTLSKDPNFWWCHKCSSGFFIDPLQSRHICPDCSAVTCAGCRKPWRVEHDQMTCEQYVKFLFEEEEESLDAVAKLLAEGINCPKCSIQYALARGGCMHFTCMQCKYEFCSGCGKPFKMGARCDVGPRCARLGLHAHHPRNCLFYLRDKEPNELQRLLKDNGVFFDVDGPIYDNPTSLRRCKVQIQKETPRGGFEDDVCGGDIEEGSAGLCRTHYIEYLAGLVARFRVDPLPILDSGELMAELRRACLDPPEREPGEPDRSFYAKVAQVIQKEIPL